MKLSPAAVKRARFLSTLTQAQVAEKLGMSQGHYANIENRARGCTGVTLRRIAIVLAADPATLIDEPDKATA